MAYCNTASALVESQAQAKALSMACYEKLASDDPYQVKQAADSLNDYTRTTMRESGFAGLILPPLPITNDECDRQVWTDEWVKVIDREPNSPAAITVPLATQPMSMYIDGERYLVTLCRVMTPRFTKDVDQLRTWVMDIRQVLSDNAIKDMMAEKDGKLIAACNAAMANAADTVVPTSGVKQWQTMGGGITRDFLNDMLKIMPSTPSRLGVQTVLINHISINDVAKFTRDEMGGDLSQKIMVSGWSEEEFLGRRWLVTIKQDLVPTNSFFHFADPKFMGKYLQAEEPTMYVKREAFMLEFYLYEYCGITLGHTSGITRSDATGV